MAPAPSPLLRDGVQDRTARIALTWPQHWRREVPSGTDLRLEGDGLVLTVRSRPSDLRIAEESAALLGRLPGSAPGLRVVGVDPWDAAGAPGRLVEYAKPTNEHTASTNDGSGTVLVSHLLLVTGRHRVDVLLERALVDVDPTDGLAFAVLESVRVEGPVTAQPSRTLEDLHVAEPDAPELGPALDPAALATLQGLAGRRWNPAALRTPGGRALVEAGVVGRFGTVPSATAAIMAPWEAGAEPTTLERRGRVGVATRLQAWSGEASVTLVDGVDEVRIGALAPDAAVGHAAWRLGITPAWTWPFRTERLPTDLVERRLAGETVSLPGDVEDEVLARFWAAPWAVTHLRRAGRPRPVTLVQAEGLGFARVGAASAGSTAFRVEASANVYRLLVRTFVG